MERRPWYERLFDRDNPVAPFVVLALLVVVIVLVLTIGPRLDRAIEGPAASPTPSSHQPGSATWLLAAAGTASLVS